MTKAVTTPRLKRNLVYNFVLSGSQVLLPLISIPYLSRVLTPDGIGKISFIDSLTYYFIALAEFGITVYGTKEIAKHRGDQGKKSQVASELVSLHLISSAFSILLYAVAIILLWHKVNHIMLLLFSLSFLLMNAFSCDWYFLGMEKFKYITIRSLVVRLAGLVSMFLLVKQPADFYIYYGIIAFSGIAVGLSNLVIMNRQLDLSFRRINLKHHLKHTWINYLISIFFAIPLMLDNVLLGMVASIKVVGLYAYSGKIIKLSASVVTDTTLVFFPRMVNLYHSGMLDELQRTILNNARMIIVLTIPMCFGLFLLSELLFTVFLGPGFSLSHTNLKILALIPFLKSCNLFLGRQLLMCFNKELLYLRALVISSVIYVPLVLVLAFFFSAEGACLALVIYEGLLLLINYISFQRMKTGMVFFDFKSFRQALISSLFFIPVVYFLSISGKQTLLVLVLTISACFFLYLLFMVYIFKNQTVREIANHFLSSFSKKLPDAGKHT